MTKQVRNTTTGRWGKKSSVKTDPKGTVIESTLRLTDANLREIAEMADTWPSKVKEVILAYRKLARRSR
jgi:hypothetical protein